MFIHTITNANGDWLRDSPDSTPEWTGDPAQAATYPSRSVAGQRLDQLHETGIIPEKMETSVNLRGTVAYIPAAAVAPRERINVPGHDYVDWSMDFIPRLEGVWLTSVGPEALPSVMAESGWHLVDDSGSPAAFTFEQAA